MDMVIGFNMDIEMDMSRRAHSLTWMTSWKSRIQKVNVECQFMWFKTVFREAEMEKGEGSSKLFKAVIIFIFFTRLLKRFLPIWGLFLTFWLFLHDFEHFCKYFVCYFLRLKVGQ